jgi:hypothetical protein
MIVIQMAVLTLIAYALGNIAYCIFVGARTLARFLTGFARGFADGIRSEITPAAPTTPPANVVAFKPRSKR